MPPPPLPHGVDVVTSRPPAPACTQLPIVRLVANTLGAVTDIVAASRLVSIEFATIDPVVFCVGVL
jgi:hypothetical protein